MELKELEKEAEVKAQDFSNNEKHQEVYRCGYLDGAYDRQNRISDLEKENIELKGIKEVATLIRANNDTVVTLMQLNNKLVSKSQQLNKAKKLIRSLLYVYQLGKNELATARVMAEAEQFLSEAEK